MIEFCTVFYKKSLSRTITNIVVIAMTTNNKLGKPDGGLGFLGDDD